jgi:hypothetical protein
MHFTTATFFFGMVGAAVAAPQPEANAAYGAMEMAGGFFPGAPNSACYCCPAAGSGSNCGRVNEDGRCQNADVLICCDAREQVSIILVRNFS